VELYICREKRQKNPAEGRIIIRPYNKFMEEFIMKKMLICILMIVCGAAFAANTTLKSPKGYTIFYSKTNEYTIANERKTSTTIKTGIVKLNSSQLVCGDQHCKRLKGIIFHTNNGLRIAVVNTNKLKNVLKYNPQWVANLNTATKGKNKYYYVNVSPTPTVWLGVANNKIAQVGIKTK
jgi:hypothetical protein